MADFTCGTTIPSILSGAWTLVTATSQLFSPAMYRRKQFEVLVDHCRDMTLQFGNCIQNEPQYLDSMRHPDDMKTGTKDIEAACESVKSMLDTVNEKGFLWCLMNPDKIDSQFKDCETKIENVFHMIDTFIQLGRMRQMNRAREDDQTDLSQRLTKLYEREDMLIEALQDQGGVRRRMQELRVAILKHVQDLSPQDVPRPEDVFLQNAAKIICRISKTDESVGTFVLSSVEVEFDVNGPSIGRGASGQVYKGDWNGAVVAVKRMHDAQTFSEDQRQAIRHEINIWSILHHPNVLTFYGACLEAAVPFLVMKYCPYGDINHYLAKHPDADRTRLSHEVAVGLAFLHNKGIVHADIKGANVLISEERHAVLSDFGLALKLFQIHAQSTYSRHIDRRRGTLFFMAPEVLGGSSPDMAADVYSLGLTIWEVFSGEVPFKDYVSPGLLIEGVVNRQKRPDRPPRLTQAHVWDIVQKCWVADPRSRLTAKAVQLALNQSNKQIADNANAQSSSDPGLSVSIGLSQVSSSSTFVNSTVLNSLSYVPSEKAAVIETHLRKRSWGDEERNRQAGEAVKREATERARAAREAAETTQENQRRLAHREPEVYGLREVSLSAQPSTQAKPEEPRASPAADTTDFPFFQAFLFEPEDEVMSVPSQSQILSAEGGDPGVRRVFPEGNRAKDGGDLPFLPEALPLTPDIGAPPISQSLSEGADASQFRGGTRMRRGKSARRQLAREPKAGTGSSQSTFDVNIPVRVSRSAGNYDLEPRSGGRGDAVRQVSTEQRLVGSGALESAPTNDMLAPSPPAPRDISPNRANMVRQSLDTFLENTSYRKWFELDASFLRTLVNKATVLCKDPTRPLASPEDIERLTRLSLYQPVIYCDDSSSMTIDDRYVTLRMLVMRITEVAMRLISDRHYGVQLRFINSRTAVKGRNDQFSTVLARVRPTGGTNIGAGLRNRILQPLVYDVLDNNKGLERPLLVSVITDGEPDPEPVASFRNAVMECKLRLINAGYKPTVVLFSISVIGGEQSAKEFVEALKRDTDIADVLYCTTDRLDHQLEEGRANAKLPEDSWLLKILTAPIMNLEMS